MPKATAVARMRYKKKKVRISTFSVVIPQMPNQALTSCNAYVLIATFN